MEEDNKKQEKNKDGDKIASILSDHSKKLRGEGRYIAYAIIAACWSISYNYMGFNPNKYAKLSIILAMLYVAVDIIELLGITCIFNRYLTKYFKPNDDGGYEYLPQKKNSRDKLEKKSKCIHCITFWILILMSGILSVSAVLLIFAVCFSE